MWTGFSVVGERGSWQEPGEHNRAEMVLAVNAGEPAGEETELVVSHGSGDWTHFCLEGTSQGNMDTIRAKEISLMKSSPVEVRRPARRKIVWERARQLVALCRDGSVDRDSQG